MSDTDRKVEGLESIGVDTDPLPHESIHCACGYSGEPEAVLRYSEVDEVSDDHDYFVCPNCGGY